MPRELFGDVSLRPGRTRTRRSSVVMVSLAAHAVVISALLIAPLFATETLPLPQHGGPLYVSRDIVLVSPPPPPRRPTINPSTPSASTTIAPASSVPLQAPSGISEETGAENLPAGSGSGTGTSDVGEGPGLVTGAFGPTQLPQPPPPIGPVRVYDGVRAPRKLVDVPPVYPPLARAARIEGIVLIEATIGRDGSVEAARVITEKRAGSHRLLEEAALDAVRQWKFSPTRLNGVPVPIIMTVTVNFTLR
jgi:periplasmic protein TonB